MDLIKLLGVLFCLVSVHEVSSQTDSREIDIQINTSFDNLKVKIEVELKEQLNKEFPDFQLITFARDTLSLLDLKGKPSILFFWDLYCQPCLDQMDLLNTIKDKWGGQVNFIAITTHSKSEVKRFLAQDKLNFVHLIDVGDTFNSALRITTMPRVYVLDKNNVVKEAIGLPEINTCCPLNDKEKGAKYFNAIISALQ